MKRNMILAAALLLGGLLNTAWADDLKDGDKLRVTTSNTVLRDAPRPFGAKPLKTLALGETVRFKGKADGAWYKVEYQGMTGYLPERSLVEAKKFSSYSKTARVSDSDVAAATKGFSPEIEQKNKADNKELRYDLMDQAETASTVKDPAEATTAFRRDGELGEFRKGGK